MFRIALPGRGHAAAAHPYRPEAIAFARRPGSFAIVVDCVSGRHMVELAAPAGRHFYGHGAFSADGGLLYTTENDFGAACGMVGVWDAGARYSRIGEFSSGGVGPHDIRRLPGTDTLVIANGGIETHPDTGRAKLNLPLMRPNLSSYLGKDGRILDLAVPDQAIRRNSVRHIAVSRDGLVAMAFQWQGNVAYAPPLLALYRHGGKLSFLSAREDEHRAMRGYAGSMALSGDEREVAITSPRGGLLQVFDVATCTHVRSERPADVCSVAQAEKGFTFTTGTGGG